MSNEEIADLAEASVPTRMGPMRHLLRPLAVPFAFAVTVGCSRSHEASSADARALGDVLAADQELEAALRDVDATSRSDEKKAAEIIETRAVPLADKVLTRAGAANVTTPWGQDRRRELAAVAQGRRDELPKYARALREGDLNAKLSAVEAQLEWQRKAMETAARVSQVPP